ncbi:hypothetical protein HS088_TW22G01001 [Tripterygium wilfordii]|uniref:PB1 domain-containing protein n=1 Tax=Tripterygium wilfordii TaxID=458696 RepID=A0A7J7BZN6_TRIWF|nr:hypothetical protein HS088_TW22G01001 [Tripterygium wilfordii]
MRLCQVVKDKLQKKKKYSGKREGKEVEKDDEVVVEEKVISRTVKLVLDKDIMWAQLPVNCSIRLVRDIVRDKYLGLKGVLVKYRDQEGDLVAITTMEELKLAELSCDSRGSFRLYITQVNLDQEPAYEVADLKKKEEVYRQKKKPKLGMKLYSEAMEDTIASEDAQELFDITSDKFQKMAALALDAYDLPLSALR